MSWAQDRNHVDNDSKLPEPGASVTAVHFQRLAVQSPRKHRMNGAETVAGTTISSTFAVTNTNDSGDGSLRKAITDANLSPGMDVIQFAIPGTILHTILPLSPLPEISDALIIDGTTQAGYAGRPQIEIDGISAGYSNGFEITADGCTIKGIAITRFGGVGIGLIGGQNSIEGCFIGIGPDGITDKGNGGEGIVAFSANNSIGNPNGNRNVISGNQYSGIRVSSSGATGNRIRNNYIGTSADGTAAVPNDITGIYIYQALQDTIGGTGFFDLNVISGNINAGIRIEGAQSQHIIIKGNRIGTNSTGVSAIGNLHGIEIIGTDATGSGPANIQIGGTWENDRNLISGNKGSGVAFYTNQLFGTGNIVSGNLIGTDATGTKKVPNQTGISIQRQGSPDITDILPGIQIGGARPDMGNVISGNSEYGIYLNQKGVQKNLIQGNYIGTTRATPITGLISTLGNGAVGILVRPSSTANIIGGTDDKYGNVIGGNGGDAIATYGDNNNIWNNYLGTDELQASDLGNTFSGVYIECSGTKVGGKNLENKIANNKESGIFMFAGNGTQLHRNSIYKNAVLGIDLFPFSITKNDSADLDNSRPNLGLNFPVLTYADLNSDHIILHGHFDSRPNSHYTLYVYKNNQRNASRFGEGEILIDSIDVTTDAKGSFVIKTRLNQKIEDTQFITALAVDDNGNTSEFTRALCLQDTDGDGISDCWETEGDGIDVNADGKIDLYLWGHGARSYHKDVFVEIDYMKDRRPADTALAMVRQAFASVDNALVNNPDGRPGIKLHLEFDQADEIPLALWNGDPWPEFVNTRKKYFGTALDRQTDSINILSAKSLVYRYCIFANAYGNEGSSGMARINNMGDAGNDFFVSLGTWGVNKRTDPKVQAGTFMHELGHTLGLQHGGNDDVNYKPNYYSVMNYTWQCPGAEDPQDKLSWSLVYSPTQLTSLMESSLLESQGLGLTANLYPVVRLPYSRPNGKFGQAVLKPFTAVDWDGDGDSTGLAKSPIDLNLLNSNEPKSPGEILTGHADWPNLNFNFRKVPGVLNKSATKTQEFHELNESMYDQLLALPPYGAEPPVMEPASFLWLGTLGGDESEAYGISDDGQVVTGWADTISGTRAFRWTPATGMQSLGTLGGEYSKALAISADGKTIVGYSEDINSVRRAFRWTAQAGMQDMGAGDYSEATAVSAHGDVITINVNSNAYQWSSSGGMVALGTLGGSYSAAQAVSDDGSVIAGYSNNASNDPHACTWSAGVITDFNAYYSFARGISGNGLNVTGSETGSANLHRAFSWSPFEGMKYNLVGNFSQGSDISYNGEYIVGDGGYGAFRLSENGGYEILNETFASLIAPGSDLWAATAISANGRFISGYGHNGASNGSYNDSEAFIVSTGGPWQPNFYTSAEKPLIVNNSSIIVRNYPNPFRTFTTIEYEVPVSTRVNIIVYNFVGQAVITLADGVKQAGKYKVSFNGMDLPGGIYLCRIKAGSHLETRKMMLVK